MHSDFDPARMRRNVLREVLGSVAHGVLYPFGYLPRRHQPLRAKDIDTVVFVHGLAANRACLFPLQLWLSRAGYGRQLSFNYSTSGSVEKMALHLKREIDDNVRGGRIHVVAHSLGGLVTRYYVQALDGDRRVSAVVTLGTPHGGTYPSVYAPSAMLQQLRPDGAFLKHLTSLPPPAHTRFTSIGARSDHLVVPSEHAFAPFGERVPLFEDLGHSTLLLSPSVFRAVQAALPLPTSPPSPLSRGTGEGEER
ncbi:MAG: alpha/beta fold hydrolase [Deltaproteobacteria bacterium]|nr:alpha/beta fold hydrolase [Deltaproteobacteria bacterium]